MSQSSVCDLCSQVSKETICSACQSKFRDNYYPISWEGKYYWPAEYHRAKYAYTKICYCGRKLKVTHFPYYEIESGTQYAPPDPRMNNEEEWLNWKVWCTYKCRDEQFGEERKFLSDCQHMDPSSVRHFPGSAKAIYNQLPTTFKQYLRELFGDIDYADLASVMCAMVLDKTLSQHHFCELISGLYLVRVRNQSFLSIPIGV